jgi:hypothetical protein
LRTLSGGVSNRTVLLERETGERWVIKQALAKLRVRSHWFCSPASSASAHAPRSRSA